MKSVALSAIVVALAAVLSSCDSPEMVRKRDQQALEITKLKGELAVVEERLKDVPPDRTEDLSGLEQEAKAQQAEITKLEGEIKDLEAKKASVEKEYEEYKRKYVVR